MSDFIRRVVQRIRRELGHPDMTPGPKSDLSTPTTLQSPRSAFPLSCASGSAFQRLLAPQYPTKRMSRATPGPHASHPA